ncbi:MAG TPA: hypothetical protein VEP90_08315 [Methylomirabilota bacterium]|nr:hypothetical protein [Methylomirabilota bacterium]
MTYCTLCNRRVFKHNTISHAEEIVNISGDTIHHENICISCNTEIYRWNKLCQELIEFFTLYPDKFFRLEQSHLSSETIVWQCE